MATSVIKNEMPVTVFENASQGIKIIRYGRICFLYYDNTTISLSSKTWRDIDNALPTGYRPIENTNSACFCGSSRDVSCLVQTATDGRLRFYNTSNSAQTGLFGMAVAYMCEAY